MFVCRGPAMSLLRRSHRPSQMDRTGRRGGVALLADYIVDLSLMTLKDGDVTQLFELLVVDPRLRDAERHELTEAFVALGTGP
ncbi:MAG: hypothetical protein A3K59_00345 [Euryarchaeota archaeon RBG_19FT_COMBO_69_17]|nr:MAG: hypothetical protein A3K59_00345 [Euryarchaeota archaeon RBG_19FT_COMBO_69_17]